MNAGAITGTWRGKSLEKLYAELGWEPLRGRRWSRRLTLFYKIINNLTPIYTKDLIPPLQQLQYSIFLIEITHTRISLQLKSLIVQKKDTKRKNQRANGIADFPGSRVLTGFQLIKCVFSCFLNLHKFGSSLMLIGISFQTLRAE